jgi:hypothetical protein
VSWHTRRAPRLTIIILSSAAAIQGGDVAVAATPLGGARYLGQCCAGALYEDYMMVTGLRVARDGHTLRRGSYVGCDEDGFLHKLPARRAVRVSTSGAFSFRGRTHGKGSVRYRVRGAFDSPDTARLTYAVRPKKRFNCLAGPRALRLHRAGEPPFSDCASQPETTIVSSVVGRVFTQHHTYGWWFMPFAYGCLYEENRRFKLGLVAPFQPRTRFPVVHSLDQFRLAGPYTAYGCHGDFALDYPLGCSGEIIVRSLRDGSLRRANTNRYGWDPWAAATDLELRDNGSVAWITRVDPRTRVVAAFDAAGKRVLDRGPRINPASLMLDGSTLTWIKDGVRRSATLE